MLSEIRFNNNGKIEYSDEIDIDEILEKKAESCYVDIVLFKSRLEEDCGSLNISTKDLSLKVMARVFDMLTKT